MIQEEERILNYKVTDGYITSFYQDKALFLKGTTTNTKNTTYFYKESIVCTVTQVTTSKKGYIIIKEKLCEILTYLEIH